VREIRFHCAHHSYSGWLVAVAVLLLSLAGCHGGPVIDLSPKPLEADGTISGIVRGPEGTSPIEGRSVEVINIDTGERERVTTNNTGGFTFKVKPGKYRVELTLLDGETLVKKPNVIQVNRSDVDAHADFIVGVVRVSRPRHPVPRVDDGLGSAIA
jgi:hypothetical protein